ncbi:hypothetical protein DM992_26480 [Burkholderia sp. JP2-270]|nr:hypothetical protein DM992_26480 [Burkholderia sp. JP2-270]
MIQINGIERQRPYGRHACLARILLLSTILTPKPTLRHRSGIAPHAGAVGQMAIKEPHRD